MTLKDCIDIVDNLKPNQYTIKEKVMWLSFIEEIIINEVLKTHEGYDSKYDDFEGYSEDKLSVPLIVPSPYDRLYTAYLKMKIDEANGEVNRYNSSSTQYNTYMLEFRKHYNKTHLPINSGIKKPIKHPTTTNAGLTEAELDNLKKELTFILTEYFSNTISDDKVYDVVNKFAQNNIQMLKGKDGKTPVKGFDYFTDKDKTELATEVINEFRRTAKLSDLVDDSDRKPVKKAELATKDKNGNAIHKTYAPKDSVPTKLSQLDDDTGNDPEHPKKINWAKHSETAEISDIAEIALKDNNGNRIHITYATKEEVSRIGELIEEIVVEEEGLSSISRNSKASNPYNFKAMFVDFEIKPCNVQQTIQIIFYDGEIWAKSNMLGSYQASCTTTTAGRFLTAAMDVYAGKWFVIGNATTIQGTPTGIQSWRDCVDYTGQRIKSVLIRSASNTLEVGSKIKIYGVR